MLRVVPPAAPCREVVCIGALASPKRAGLDPPRRGLRDALLPPSGHRHVIPSQLAALDRRLAGSRIRDAAASSVLLVLATIKPPRQGSEESVSNFRRGSWHLPVLCSLRRPSEHAQASATPTTSGRANGSAFASVPRSSFAIENPALRSSTRQQGGGAAGDPVVRDWVACQAARRLKIAGSASISSLAHLLLRARRLVARGHGLRFGDFAVFREDHFRLEWEAALRTGLRNAAVVDRLAV